MLSLAQRREQLESHLEKFREIANQKNKEKIQRWSCHIPAVVSLAILLSQIANTIIFGSFAYNFNSLNELIDDYVHETDAMNVTLPNSTVRYSMNMHAEKLVELDKYQNQLWNLFIGEVIELIFPIINLLMFAWIVKEKNRSLPSKIQAIYVLCPALALVLSITQALTIHVSITESIYMIRFFLAKILNILVEINKKGRLPIEAYFECEFFNDDDIIKPPCAGQIHDTVLSKSTLTVVIIIHVIPIVIFIYVLIRNLTSNKSEHLFLYIESVNTPAAQAPATHDPQKKIGMGVDDIIHQVPNETNAFKSNEQQRQLRNSVNQMLQAFNTKFVSKRVFQEHLKKGKRVSTISTEQ